MLASPLIDLRELDFHSKNTRTQKVSSPCTRYIVIDKAYLYPDSGAVTMYCPSAWISYHHSTCKYFDETYLKANYHSYIALDDMQKEQWATTEKEKMNIIREVACRKCASWLQIHTIEHTYMSNEICRKHVDEIVKRLTDMGWGEFIKDMQYSLEHIQCHPPVYQKKELTECVWNNIRPCLIEYLEEQKEQCFEHKNHMNAGISLDYLNYLHYMPKL
ncbi:hypothetical protein BDQ17DRAFT_1466351 [Cyathus striatus]|nr:hypothetical protein BDQ17DRAFT_1466351 [Cyathus striatus]